MLGLEFSQESKNNNIKIKKMSAHDQMFILEKIEEIINEINCFEEDNCPNIYNILHNNLEAAEAVIKSEINEYFDLKENNVIINL